MAPENRIGKLTGPDNRTNTDLYNVLQQIAQGLGSFATMSADIAQIKNDLRRLVGAGDALGWPGLSAYLDYAIRPVAQPPFGGQPSIAQYLFNTQTSTAQTAAFLTNGTPGGPNTPYLVTANARLQAIVDAINALETGGGTPGPDYTAVLNAIQGGVAGLQGQLNAISNDLGTITETPAGLPIKGVLNLIALATDRAADCCEDGGGGVDPDPTNPPANTEPDPASTCALTSGPLRASGLRLVETGSDGAGLYEIQFPGLEDVSPFARVQDSVGLRDIDGFVAPTDMSLCLVWDFTDNPIPASMRYILANPWNSGSGGGALISPGDGQWFRGTLNAGVGIAWTLTVDADGFPSNGTNFWLYWEQTPE